ncbi:hypothetical protein PAL_GLEAN10006880 [Pteropus alecto]|uniref:Uncharacterized protein n=1 Tax=Pteropus alecto TaxID=9402 RepID=L5L675_PTEAL|nr:hypothetical protein PAL_GLEAN10006880 [Pteropus alecto]
MEDRGGGGGHASEGSVFCTCSNEGGNTKGKRSHLRIVTVPTSGPLVSPAWWGPGKDGRSTPPRSAMQQAGKTMRISLHIEFHSDETAFTALLNNCGLMTKILQVTAESNDRARIRKVIPELLWTLKCRDFEGCLPKSRQEHRGMTCPLET